MLRRVYCIRAASRPLTCCPAGLTRLARAQGALPGLCAVLDAALGHGYRATILLTPTKWSPQPRIHHATNCKLKSYATVRGRDDELTDRIESARPLVTGSCGAFKTARPRPS